MEQTTHLPAINTVKWTASLGWLHGGMKDFIAAPLPCIIYGCCLAALSAGYTAALFLTGAGRWLLALIVGFLLIAPMLAMGLYEAGRLLEQGRTPKLKQVFFVRSAFRRDAVFLGLALVMIYSIWVEAAFLIYGLSTSRVHPSFLEFLSFLTTEPNGIRMAVIGTIIGGVIAFLAFALVVISAPMLLNETSDVFIATITSARAVIQNFIPMMIWACLIAALIGIGVLTGFLGLIIIFPVIGLASWRAYRDLVPSSNLDLSPTD